MTTYTLDKNQRAIVFRDGRPYRWLGPGRHSVRAWFATLECITYDVTADWEVLTPELDAMAPDDEASRLEVPEGWVAALRRDGFPADVLEPGRYLLWQVRSEITAELVSTRKVTCALPAPFWDFVATKSFLKLRVGPSERCLLYVDHRLAEVLEPGRYLVPRRDRAVETTVVELREREIQIPGQELMTADNVTLRVTMLGRYRVVDPVASITAVDALWDALYAEIQMATRRWVAGSTLEELLERRVEGAAAMADEVRAACETWGVELRAVDIKDIVLPGEMKSLLNRVIEAQKEAEASIITRREETASTRSLANTAKMLEANPTLLRLKELEALKEIAASVESVTVVAGEQSLRLLSGK